MSCPYLLCLPPLNHRYWTYNGKCLVKLAHKEPNRDVVRLFSYEEIGGSDEFQLSHMSPIESIQHAESTKHNPLKPSIIRVRGFAAHSPMKLSGEYETRAELLDYKTMKAILQK